MPQFFAFIGGPDGQKYYLDAEERKTVMAAGYDPDNHNIIAKCCGVSALPPYVQYQYNPFSGEFTTVVHPNGFDDYAGHARREAHAWAASIDLSALVPGVIIKRTVSYDTFKGREITAKDNELLAKWAAIYDTFGHSCANINRFLTANIMMLGVSGGVLAAVRQAVLMRQTYSDPFSSTYNSRFAADEAYISTFFKLKYQISGIDSAGHDNPMWPVEELYKSGLIPVHDGREWKLVNRV